MTRVLPSSPGLVLQHLVPLRPAVHAVVAVAAGRDMVERLAIEVPLQPGDLREVQAVDLAAHPRYVGAYVDIGVFRFSHSTSSTACTVPATLASRSRNRPSEWLHVSGSSGSHGSPIASRRLVRHIT